MLPDPIYEVISQAARYWFLFLMVLIVWRSYRWLARDRKQSKKRLKLLPDAGYVGELVVLAGNQDLSAGLALPISSEGTLGNLRGNDVCVPVRGVRKKHLWFEFDDELGLRVEPYGAQRIEVDGVPISGRRKPVYMSHGSRLTVGDAVLRLRLFAGFEQAGIQHAPTADFADEAQPQTFPPQPGVVLTPEQIAAFQQMQWMAAWQAMQAQAMQNGMPGQVPQDYPTVAMPTTAQPVVQGGTTAESAVLATEQGEFVPPPKLGSNGSILASEPIEQAYTQQDTTPMRATSVTGRMPRASRDNPLPPLADEPQPGDWQLDEDVPTADMLWADMHASESNRLDSGMDFAPQDEPTDAFNTTFAPRVTYYPLESDDAGIAPLAPEALDLPPTEATWPYAQYPQSEAQFADAGYTYPEYIEPDGVDAPYEYADEDEAPRSLYVEPDEAEKAKRLLWDRYLKGGRHP